MSFEKEIIIKDSCVIIDLIDLDLLDNFYKLDFRVLTTSLVIDEITDSHQASLVNELVESGELIIEDGELENITELNEKHPRLSLADSSVLELALRKEAIVLSSDGALRKISTERQLNVKGVLWVIEELHMNGILSVNEAITLLRKYPIVNNRAPKEPILTLITKLSKIKPKTS